MPSRMAKAVAIIPAGGIILPVVDECVSTFAARCAGNPERFIAGMVNTPVVATLPWPEPDREPMYVEPMMATNPAPPRNRPNIARMMAMKSSITVVLASSDAEIINTMMTYKLESFIPFQMKVQMFDHDPVMVTRMINAASMHSYSGRFRSVKPMIATTNTAAKYRNSIGICFLLVFLFVKAEKPRQQLL